MLGGGLGLGLGLEFSVRVRVRVRALGEPFGQLLMADTQHS